MSGRTSERGWNRSALGGLVALAVCVGCVEPASDRLLVTKGIDAEPSFVSGSPPGSTARNQEVELVPIGLVGPLFGADQAFVTACDLSEESFERCL